MKIIKSIPFLIATAVAAQAAVVEFDLSPTGTDAAVGLSPLNVVPAVTNSVGTGDELGEGITYDTELGLLMLNIGYGAAAGFTNLTGAATLTHIHGPAPTGEVAGVVVNLEPIHFVAFTSATNGGIIQGAVMLDTNMAEALLDGLWYVNIHTEANPAGEIRGQLIPANSAPTIICSEDTVTECGDSTTTEIHVSDADGDEVTILWRVNDMEMEPVTIPGDAALAGTNIVITAEYPLGTNVLEFVAVDAAEQSSRCSTTVVVEDTIAPVIVRASADPERLWPPNHKMVPVEVKARVEDACGEARWRITKVTSNEPINGTGDGNTEPDWKIIDRDTVELRAERSGNHSGRVYTIWLEAKDEAGNVSDPKTVEVVVPHDQRQVLKWWLQQVWRR